MKTRTLAIIIALLGAACSANPTAPSVSFSAEERTFTDVFDRNVQIQWTCATQPRLYYTPEGQYQWEIDYYTQPQPCPDTPIE